MVMSIYRNCALYKSFMETETDSSKVEEVFDIELKKFGISKEFFNVVFNLHSAEEDFERNCVGLMNCYLYFSPKYDKFLDKILYISIARLFLHKIIHFGIIEEKLYRDIMEQGWEEKLGYMCQQHKTYDNINQYQYLKKVLFPKEYLYNFLDKKSRYDDIGEWELLRCAGRGLEGGKKRLCNNIEHNLERSKKRLFQ